MVEYLVGAATPILSNYFNNLLLSKGKAKNDKKEKLELLITLCSTIPDFVHEKWSSTVYNTNMSFTSTPLIELEKSCITFPELRGVVNKITYAANKIQLNAGQTKVKIFEFSSKNQPTEAIYEDQKQLYYQIYQDLMNNIFDLKKLIYNIQDKKSRIRSVSENLMEKIEKSFSFKKQEKA